MGDMTKLGEALGAFERLRPADDLEWDAIAGEWLPAGTMAKRKAESDTRERLQRFAASGCAVTDEVLDAMRYERLVETDATRAIADFCGRRQKPWLVLSGPTGVGKTVAVAHLLWTLGGKLVRADELVRLFASMFGDQYEQQQKLRDAHRLVLDDVGGELDHTRMLPALLDLLDSRKSARTRPTIVTTNLGKKDFAARYQNERLMSRMAESVHWVSLTGDDLRRRK